MATTGAEKEPVEIPTRYGEELADGAVRLRGEGAAATKVKTRNRVVPHWGSVAENAGVSFAQLVVAGKAANAKGQFYGNPGVDNAILKVLKNDQGKTWGLGAAVGRCLASVGVKIKDPKTSTLARKARKESITGTPTPTKKSDGMGCGSLKLDLMVDGERVELGRWARGDRAGEWELEGGDVLLCAADTTDGYGLPDSLEIFSSCTLDQFIDFL